MKNTRYSTIFLFAGQGAQYQGMGAGLYRAEPVFKSWMDALDQIPRQQGLGSVVNFLYGRPQQGSALKAGFGFDRILYSHPALFMVQFSLAKTLIHYKVMPDCLIGASLGEYVALALAKVVSPRDMLRALIHHAGQIDRLCFPGGMAGVADRPARFDRDPMLNENVSLAGISSPDHFVISGSAKGMDMAMDYLKKTNTVFYPLPVPVGFHSPHIEPARAGWEKILKDLTDRSNGLNRPQMDIISCVTGQLLCPVDLDILVRIGATPVLFSKALNFLALGLTQGPEPFSGFVNIYDLGPGGAMSGFVRQNKRLSGKIKIFRTLTRVKNEIRNLNKVKKEEIQR
ncbi:MAG: acyltransferase domain-containing protein [Desulfobacter sp.]|nr:acyltransferase domain-containing protein [Desulfobacter sp.]